MFIGCLIFVFCIVVMTIGTKQGDAVVLYYDAEYVPDTSDEEAEATETVDASDEAESIFSPEFLEEESAPVSAPTTERRTVSKPGMRVSVGGETLRSGVHGGSEEEDSMSALRAAARKYDPTKKAQDIFDKTAGGRL